MPRQCQLQASAEGQPDSRQGLESLLNLWNADSRAQGLSEKYLYTRTSILKNFLWWLEQVHGVTPTLDNLNSVSIRSFLAYLREPAPQGRFGCRHANASKPVRPATLNRNFRDIRTFVNFLKAEGILHTNPLQNVKAPKIPKDQIQPLTGSELNSLLQAAAASVQPERNRAILLLLLDTGLRLSELCSLSLGALQSNCVEVIGKGAKRRTVFFAKTTRRSLNAYISRCRQDAEDDAPLFVSTGGSLAGEALTPNGVYQLVAQLTGAAGIKGKRVSPHVFRHTFCINFLRNGGNLLTLQQIVGHSDLSVLKRYVALSEEDLAVAHRLASPADRLGLR